MPVLRPGGTEVPEQELKDVETAAFENPDHHLDRLLAPELEEKWIVTFIRDIKEAINPPKLPPLEVTSKPVELKSLGGMYDGNETKSGLVSLLIHCAVVAFILFLGTLKPVQKLIQEHVTLLAPPIADYQPQKPVTHQGGGGGGARSPLEASKGKLPQISHKQFTPPRVDPVDAKLPMVPTIIADTPPPNINSPVYGDPLSHMGTPSNGTGFGGGIGSGSGGGVGSGKGPGAGPGSGGGFGGGVYRIGGGVSQPTIIHKVEPEYSEEARKAKWQGTVQLSIVIDENGHPRDPKVTKALGLGLDQKAIEAVEKWIFKPGMKDGKPVAVYATIEVTFHLL
ncbi:MAG TPA: energy transducer TonB [Bryobacteraceae bacterium]|nr:energy transducer TonB [Bryobacteraceae bacterium]